MNRERLVTGAWLRMARLTGRVFRRMDQHFQSHGLTSPQFDVLATLLREGPLSQQALANALLVSKGNVSFVVTRMVDAGLIERQAGEDARSVSLVVTRAGRTLYDAVMPGHDAILLEQFTSLDRETLEALARTLRALEPMR